MKCMKCNRKLTAKISKQRGYGPTCWNKVQAQKKTQLNWDLVKNLINLVAHKVSSKTLELLTILKVNVKAISKITESNEIIDRIIRPLIRIVDPQTNENMVVF